MNKFYFRLKFCVLFYFFEFFWLRPFFLGLTPPFIPRTLSELLEGTLGRTVIKFELHVFANASMLGYGVVAYIKTVYRDNSTQCCFVFGKSRVAPLKPVSVPRLELTAAVLAAKISQFVIREGDFKFLRVLSGLIQLLC